LLSNATCFQAFAFQNKCNLYRYVAGTVTVPIGYASVYGGERPDLFVVNNRLSTEPGLYLYQYLGGGLYKL
jgi:hypothetical protein